MEIKFHIFVATALERGWHRLDAPVPSLPVKTGPDIILCDIVGYGIILYRDRYLLSATSRYAGSMSHKTQELDIAQKTTISVFTAEENSTLTYNCPAQQSDRELHLPHVSVSKCLKGAAVYEWPPLRQPGQTGSGA
jgi:hypothetical protein